MSASALTCPRCHESLAPLTAAELAALTNCPRCRQVLEITLLPAYGRAPTVGQVGSNRTADDDPACFFHASKRAEVPCDQCGRFLCALCQLVVAGQNLCPTCLASGAGGPRGAWEKERFRWDLLAWFLVLGPPLSLCLWFLSPLTSLVALGIGVWKLNSPPSRIHRSRRRLVVAVLAAVVLLLAAGGLITFLATNRS